MLLNKFETNFYFLFRHTLFTRAAAERQPLAEVGGERLRDDPAAGQPRPHQLQHQEDRGQGLRTTQPLGEVVS
jgi:hypothetical protein